MNCKIVLTPQAIEDLSCLDKPISQNIANKIDWLSQHIDSIIPVSLKGNFKGMCKLRVGDWRVIYSFEKASQIITVYAVKHRSKVYKT